MNRILLSTIAVLALFAENSVGVTVCTTCNCYAMFSANPTFCLTQNNCAGGGPTGIPNNMKQVIVDRINHHRSEVASGRVTGIPGAKGMPKVEYDETIAITAQRWVNQCSNQPHDDNDARFDPRGYVGQNGASKSAASTILTESDIITFIDSWASESQYVIGNNEILTTYAPSPDRKKPWGHFTQLVDEKSWKVGCGFSVSITDSKSVFYCNFLIGGNLLYNPIYAVASDSSEICQSCPSNTVCNEATKLCDSLNSNGPQWRTPISGLDCSPALPNCTQIGNGSNFVSTQSTYEDQYLHIKLNSNQEVALNMVPQSGTAGVQIEYRYGNQNMMNHTNVQKPVITIWFISPSTLSVNLPLSGPIKWTKSSIGFSSVLDFGFIVRNPNNAPTYIDIRRVSNKQ